MTNLRMKDAVLKGYAMIIDKDGNPCIDDPSACPPEAWNKLSKAQQDYANAQVGVDKQYVN